MPLTHFPYGASSFGIPLVGSGASAPLTIPNVTGSMWFVDGTNGNDGNGGTDPIQAFKTIARAHLLAKAGDTIFVFVGTYAENIVITKNYIALIGVTFAGYGKPDLTPATGVPLTVQGQGFMSRHMRFAGTAADGVVQNGNGFLYDDCVFDGDLTATKCGLRLVPAQVGTDITHFTASEGTVTHCLFRGCATGLIFDTAPGPVGVGSTDNLIVGNRFYSNTIDIATAKTGAAGTYSVQLVNIVSNVFADKNKTTYIDITTNEDGPAASQTGAIVDCEFSHDAITTTQIKMVGTGFTVVGSFQNSSTIINGSALD